MTATQNLFAMAPGGGIDIPFSDRGAVRAGASLRLIRSETFTATGSRSITFSQLQIIGGLVFR